MQIFSKLHFNLCNLLNINKIQWYNLLQRKTRPFCLCFTPFRIVKGGERESCFVVCRRMAAVVLTVNCSQPQLYWCF